MPAPSRAVPICYVNELSGRSISGWGVDGSTAKTLGLHVILDGQEVAQVLCNEPLPEVPAGLRHPHANVGFTISVPAEYVDGKPHKIELRDVYRRLVVIQTASGASEHLEIQEVYPLRAFHHVDGVRNGGFEGWILRNSPDSDGLQGNAMVRVTCDDITIGHVRADRHRGDVGKAMAATGNCGFRFEPPKVHLKSYEQTFRFFLMPENLELDGSPCRTGFITDDVQLKLHSLMESVDRLYAQMTTLRHQFGSIVYKQRFTTSSYDQWYRQYEPALVARTLAAREMREPGSRPLISVICPAYRPRLPDFRAAVQSVLDQTYENWELIIVNDGSKDAALSALITELAEADPRVKVVNRTRNQGISAATNAALAVAKGEWVAFFDHDDLLVSVALELMIDAAERTGAEMLYSDEDKIDDGGVYSEPAFKPDWNHRLALGVNYICHLLLVRKSRLDEAGPLNRALDGAQDHDLILRLCEKIPRQSIHHVPEVLYHWRKTPQSTASSVSNKDYAVKAGVSAVSGHLERIGQPAHVEPMLGITLYKVNFKTTKTPKVTIIIPFKDQIETTMRCIDAIRSTTNYKNYDIILVDNWSTSAEYPKFAAAIEKRKNVKILRVEEEFNYSRLNNFAVSKTNSEFVVFMNNDVFVTKPDWLRTSLDELQVNPEVGIVGGLFYYPNGTVQHAGVVLGIGGVAGHVHVGVPRGEYGYAGRMLFPQEMSAVTAAGMVVRTEAFKKVGGFDEIGLRVAFNDIDFCMKVSQAGYRIIWTPEFEADHHESLSRGDDERPAQEARFFREVQLMKERWGSTLANDPFYNKHFSLDHQAYFDLRDPTE